VEGHTADCAAAQRALPVYSYRFRGKKSTQHQLVACLVLREFFKTAYRDVCQTLTDCGDLRAGIALMLMAHWDGLRVGLSGTPSHGPPRFKPAQSRTEADRQPLFWRERAPQRMNNPAAQAYACRSPAFAASIAER
jgi:hypothetical protein